MFLLVRQPYLNHSQPGFKLFLPFRYVADCDETNVNALRKLCIAAQGRFAVRSTCGAERWAAMFDQAVRRAPKHVAAINRQGSANVRRSLPDPDPA